MRLISQILAAAFWAYHAAAILFALWLLWKCDRDERRIERERNRWPSPTRGNSDN